jgi:hypothetical protein
MSFRNLSINRINFLAILVILLTLIAGMFVHVFPVLGFKLEFIPGDLGDGRLNLYFLEHAHQFFSGDISDYWNAPFMYPEQNVIAYSDNLLGSAPVYSIFRWLGFNKFTAYQLWFICIAVLNFYGAYLLIKFLFKNPYAAALGAFVFAFSIALQSQITHAQTFPRFAIPLVILMIIKYERSNLSPKFLFLALLFLTWQIYCGIYMGFMLAVPVGVFILILFIRLDVRKYLKNKAWLYRSIATVVANIILLLPLMLPYIERKNSPTLNKFFGVLPNIPTLQSYFFSKDGSLAWGFLEAVGKSENGWWDQQLFAGGIATSSVLLVLFLLIRKLKNSGKKGVLGLKHSNLIFSALVSKLIFLRFWKISLYAFVFVVPGFSAMRALARIINIELLFAGIAVAYVFILLLQKIKSKAVFFVFIAALFLVSLDNYVHHDSIYKTEKSEIEDRFQALNNTLKDIPEGSLISYEPTNKEFGAFVYQIDAMLAAQENGLTCINAYTGSSPDEYTAFWFNLNEESRNSWLAEKNIEFDSLYVIHNENSYSKIALR